MSYSFLSQPTPAAGGGGFTQVIEELFETDLGGFDDLTETGWARNATNSTAENSDTANFQNRVMLHSTAAAADVHILYELANDGTNQTPGLVVRQADSTTKNAHYQIMAKGTTFQVDQHQSGGSFEETIASMTITAVGNGDYLGVNCVGTGSSVAFELWDFGTSKPGGDPSTWGAADYTLTYGDNETPGGTPIDTGNYVGVRCYTSNNQSAAVEIDDFTVWTGS